MTIQSQSAVTIFKLYGKLKKSPLRAAYHNWEHWSTRDSLEEAWEAYSEISPVNAKLYEWEVREVYTSTTVHQPDDVWERGKSYTYDYDKNSTKTVWECIYVWTNGRAVLVHKDGDDMVARANNRYDYTEA